MGVEKVFVEYGEGIAYGADAPSVGLGDFNLKNFLDTIQKLQFLRLGNTQIFQIAEAPDMPARYEKMPAENAVYLPV
jgi:hypothetical protein